MTWLLDTDAGLVLTVLWGIGYAARSVLRGEDWFHRPVVEDLQLTDAYHACGWLIWPLPCWVALVARSEGSLGPWGLLALVAAWTAPWVICKALVGKLRAWGYLWPVVVGRWAWRRLRGGS